MAQCDIVIPFFQRKPGILQRAVASVASQDWTDWRLIIVDDGSPQPPDEDLAAFGPDLTSKVDLIRQQNKGVSGARNAGLNAVSGDALMVAFLDSDDEWTPGHLTRVMRAGEAGADLFWDAVALGDDFDSDSRPSEVAPADCTVPVEGLDWAIEATRIQSILTGQWWRHMHLSCTAVSAAVARQVRFREHLSFCEDFAFYIDSADLSKKVLFSDETGVVRGVGDNVWHNVDFKDRRFADEKFNMFFLLSELRSHPQMREADVGLIDLRLQVCRELFYWNQNARIKAGQSPMWRHWARWMSRDPKLISLVLSLVFRYNKNKGKTLIPGESEGF